MSHALTETTTYDSTVTVPDDGDPVNAASVNNAFQALADRTAFLNDILTNTGVKKIQRFANTAAMLTYNGQVDGEVCIVDSYGVFEFHAGTLFFPPGVIGVTQFASTGGAVGYWFCIGLGVLLQYVTGGYPTLDANNKIPANHLHGAAINYLSSTNVPGTVSVSIGSNIPTAMVVSSVAPNDLLVINTSLNTTATAGGNYDFVHAIDFGSGIVIPSNPSIVELPSAGPEAWVQLVSHVKAPSGATTAAVWVQIYNMSLAGPVSITIAQTNTSLIQYSA